MSSIIVQQRRVWTRQPPGPVQLDKKLPVLFFVPCSAAGHVDLITGVTGEVVGNPSTEANSIGVLTRFGTGKRIRFPPLSVAGTTPIIIAWVQEGISPSSYQATADIGYQGGASFLLYNSTADVGYGVSCGKGAGAAVFPTAGKMIDREINRFALMCSDGLAGGAASFVLFKNGVQHAASPTTLSSPSNPYIEIGSRANGSDSFFGRIGNFAILKGADRSIALELSANPWQIFARRDRRTIINFGVGGATSVYSDSALSYYIRSLLSSDSGISYAIRNAIYQDDAVGYYLRASVAQNSAIGYVLRSAIAKDATAAYLMRGLVQTDDNETYSLRALVQTSDNEAYTVRSAVSADTSAVYDVLSSSSVASNSSVSYSVRGSVTANSSQAYVVRSATQSDQVIGYSLRSSVSRDLSSAYGVSASESSVYSDLWASYSVDGVAPACPTAESIAAAVVSALQGTTIPADARMIAGQPIYGNGRTEEFHT